MVVGALVAGRSSVALRIGRHRRGHDPAFAGELPAFSHWAVGVCGRMGLGATSAAVGIALAGCIAGNGSLARVWPSMLLAVAGPAHAFQHH